MYTSQEETIGIQLVFFLDTLKRSKSENKLHRSIFSPHILNWTQTPLLASPSGIEYTATFPW